MCGRHKQGGRDAFAGHVSNTEVEAAVIQEKVVQISTDIACWLKEPANVKLFELRCGGFGFGRHIHLDFRCDFHLFIQVRFGQGDALQPAEQVDETYNHKQDAGNGNQCCVSSHSIDTAIHFVNGAFYTDNPLGTLDGVKIEQRFVLFGFNSEEFLLLSKVVGRCLVPLLWVVVGDIAQQEGGVGMADESVIAVNQRDFGILKGIISLHFNRKASVLMSKASTPMKFPVLSCSGRLKQVTTLPILVSRKGKLQ